jgi:uncharacterized protein
MKCRLGYGMCFVFTFQILYMKSQRGDVWEIRDAEFGKGLFAIRNIKAHEVICSIHGRSISFEDTLTLNDQESYALQIDVDHYIYGQPPFVISNHSCNPNCGISENLELIAIKDIGEGEELCWDYSTSMLERHWTMECNCGEKNCRRIIKDFDLLPYATQIHYLQLHIVMPFIVQALYLHHAKTA